MEAALSPLRAWESFYVIVGSSAAALTGLQFVVMALMAESRKRSSYGQIATFGTPTILHFCAVLLLSATLTAPWRALSSASLVLGSCGAAGVGYVLIVLGRARRQTSYQPVFEDWLFHAMLPLLAYGVLLIAAIEVPRHPASGLFSIAGAVLLLLFIGIHNAWDAVTYIMVEHLHPAEKPEAEG